jgi:hypothetical protein
MSSRSSSFGRVRGTFAVLPQPAEGGVPAEHVAQVAGIGDVPLGIRADQISTAILPSAFWRMRWNIVSSRPS